MAALHAMHDSNTTWFGSEVDWSIRLILIAVPLLEVAFLFNALLRGDRAGITATATGLGIVAAIYLLLVVPVRYGIAEDSLLVHFGVVRQRIPFRAIQEMYPTRAPLSSPALSFDRLAIRTGRGPLHLTLISPVRREEFLGLVTTRAGLVWNGSGWVPRSARASG